MKYKINWCEVKTVSALNKRKLSCELVDDALQTIANVDLWEDRWPIDTLKPGSEVSGEIVTKQSGKFTNKTLYPERTNTRTAPSAPAWAKNGNSGAVKAAKITSDSVSEAQTRKEASITKAAILRDSTLLTVAMLNAYAAGKIIDPDEVKKDWGNWKSWLEGEYNDPGVPF